MATNDIMMVAKGKRKFKSLNADQARMVMEMMEDLSAKIKILQAKTAKADLTPKEAAKEEAKMKVLFDQHLNLQRQLNPQALAELLKSSDMSTVRLGQEALEVKQMTPGAVTPKEDAQKRVLAQLTGEAQATALSNIQSTGGVRTVKPQPAGGGFIDTLKRILGPKRKTPEPTQEQ